MTKTKLILICDTKNEIDDQMAIAYALCSPEIDLLAVVSTQNNRRGGENSTQIYHAEAKKLLKLANAKIPALKGATRVLDLNRPERSEGVAFIIKKILKHQGSNITIACTGPATDIANLCLLEPRIVAKINFIWAGELRNHLESNFRGDKRAARLLPKLKINLTISPIFMNYHGLIVNTRKFHKFLKSVKTPLSEYLADLISWNWQRLKFITRLFFGYWISGDLAVIAIAKNFGINSQINIGEIKVAQSIDGGSIVKNFFSCIRS